MRNGDVSKQEAAKGERQQFKVELRGGSSCRATSVEDNNFLSCGTNATVANGKLEDSLECHQVVMRRRTDCGGGDVASSRTRETRDGQCVDRVNRSSVTGGRGRKTRKTSFPSDCSARNVNERRGGIRCSLSNSSVMVEKLCGCCLKLNYCYKAIIISTILVVLMLSVFAVYFGLMNPKWKPADRIKANDTLIPPNPELAQPQSPSVLHVFSNAAVCSDSDICSRIGRDTFTRGGGIIDGTLATMFCLGMVNMQSMGIGGGFIMNIYIKSENKAFTLDAREVAAGAAFREMHLSDPKSTNEGPLSIGTPGEIKGYAAAHARFGKLPWHEVIAPAIKLCEDGFAMSKHMEDSLRINPIVKKDAKLRRMFYNETAKDFHRMGAWIQPDRALCATLRKIAERGGEDMYSGHLADELAADLRDMGSIITKEDLAAYKVKWMDSIPVQIGGDTMYITPPPSSGLLLGFILNILKGYEFSPASISSINETTRTYHRIIEAYKWAYGKRSLIGDPDFSDLSQLLRDIASDEVAEEIRGKIDDMSTRTKYEDYGGQFYMGNDNGTGHISLIGPNGDAVSLTSSVNFYFGCGSMGQRTGIILNSGMDDFSSPGLKNYFGLPGSPRNYIEPRKRALNSMSPTIITDKSGAVKLVIGAAGGTKITTSVAMAIIRILYFGQNIKEAIDAPRFHHQLIPMELEYEYGVLDQYVKGLEALGHKTKRFHHRGSVICAIHQNTSAIYANADFRKAGDVFGF